MFLIAFCKFCFAYIPRTPVLLMIDVDCTSGIIRPSTDAIFNFSIPPLKSPEKHMHACVQSYLKGANKLSTIIKLHPAQKVWIVPLTHSFTHSPFATSKRAKLIFT
eukprot:m.110448 g.110448  ORF g.110448 m.110448 type:complete len:106 (-) comp12747_c0_seq3:1618-1935(-)